MAGKDGELLLYTVGGFFFGLISFIFGFVRLKEKRMIENIPTSKVRSIAMGLVEVNGNARKAESTLFISPLSGKECVYYKLNIEEYQTSGKHSSWVTIKKSEKKSYFYLQDDTGRVLVDPTGAEFDLKKKFNLTRDKKLFGKEVEIPEGARQYMINNGMESRLKHSSLKFSEYYIEPNERLYIMGTAGDNPYVEDGSAIQGVNDVMIHKGENQKFYYISENSETDVLKRLAWQAFAGIFGGAALTIASLTYIVYFFELF